MGNPLCMLVCTLLPIDTAIDSQENIFSRVNNCKNHKCFPLESFAIYGSIDSIYLWRYILSMMVANYVAISYR